jgi:predicted NBD/HSP70 family sugar kinase
VAALDRGSVPDLGDRGRDAGRLRLPGGELGTLITVLDLVRTGAATTRQEIEAQAGLGRAVVTDRVATLIAMGLVKEGDLGPSTGGRAPRQVRFREGAGFILVAAIGNTSLGAGLADLGGRLLVEHHERSGVDEGAEHTLDRLEELFDWILSEHAVGDSLWGIGLSVVGPVELPNSETGSGAVVHLAPDWAENPVADRLAARFHVPAWVDNDAHLMALGELRAGRGVGRSDLLYLKIGTSISAGLVSNGQVHRGANGYAGDIGHVVVADEVLCRCGNVGCLDAVAGGLAIARDAGLAVAHGRSPYLAQLAMQGIVPTAAEVGMGAYRGDPYCIELLARCGQLIGATLATLVAAYNPSLVVVGGGVSAAGEILLSAMRESLYRRSRSLATRDVSVVRSEMGRTAGLVGAAFAVVDDLFGRERVRTWIADGRPARVGESQGSNDGARTDRRGAGRPAASRESTDSAVPTGAAGVGGS